MKKIKYTLIALFLISSTQSFAQDKKPKSPPKEVSTTIGDAKVTINYCSPSVRGREVYGGLEPFGKIWRAGANEATTFEFTESVTVNGQELPAGKYSFFVTPEKGDTWTIRFNSEWKQWGAYKLDQSKDVLVVEAKTKKIDTVENLTYSVERNNVFLDWANTRLYFEVE